MNNDMHDVKILIVEDEQLTALVLKETLESMGFGSVDIVAAGEQAIARAEETRPDLLLMDIVIEGNLDGIETAGQIRRRFDIPAIYLTALANEETMQRAKQTEPFAYLIKPYNERELKFIIEMAIYKQRIEKELKESEEKYRTLFDNAGVMIVAINTDHEVELINQKGCEVLGYSENEIIGKNWFDHFIPENERAKVKEVLVRLLKGEGESYRYFENHVLTEGGQEKVIAWNNTLLKDESGRITGTLSSGADITERNRVENALRESEERYRTLLENIPVGIFRSTPEGQILSANPTMITMLGYRSEAETLTTPIIDTYLVPAQRKALLELLEEKGLTTGFEAQFKRPDGSTFWGSLNVKGITDKQGKLVQMDGIMADITQRKKMEDEMLKAEKLESLGILAGGIAHDFNNILASILVNVGLAKMNIENRDKVVTKLSDIEKAIVRAKNLTQQLLTFSKGGAPVRSPTPIDQLLKETADFASSGSNVKCDCIIPPNLWNADIDEGQISQVIQNLIINAKQAMPRGGIIQIGAENVTVGIDDALPLKHGEYLKITVKDHGIGIPPSHLDMIFDPFFTTKQKGSGLGLSTVYSIVKNHNGLITVESELGKGTTFYIYLPASGEKEVKKDELPEVQAEDTAAVKGKILLMDDEDDVLDTTAEVLQEIGYTVEAVRDGAQVVECYEKARQSGRPFDLVMMDLVVPGGLGGKETLRELLQIDPHVKAVVSTGYSTDPVIGEYKEYGFVGAVSKPYRIKDLIAVLKEVLGGKA